MNHPFRLGTNYGIRCTAIADLAALRVSQRFSPLARIFHCRHSLTFGNHSTFCAQSKSGTVSWANLARCESHWGCTWCTPWEGALDAERLADTLHLLRSDGMAIYFVTLTARHFRQDSLEDLMTRFQAARRAFFGARSWRALAQSTGFLGTVRSWEATHGQAHGWHAHTHEFCCFPTPGIQHMLHNYYPAAWADACKSVGLYSSRSFGTRIDEVTGTSYKAAATYTCAWGPEQELTMSPYKTAKGGNRTVWDLLKAATQGSDEGADLWAEYSLATRGRKRLSWSGKLRDYIADRREPDMPDTEPLEWSTLTGSAWHVLRRHHGDVRVLQLLGDHNIPAAHALITRATLEDPLYNRYAAD